MKQKDIATIAFIVFVSAVASIIISKLIISTPKSRQEKIEIVEPISADFTRPSEKYFNSSSINPTQTIKIGGDGNTKPFGN